MHIAPLTARTSIRIVRPLLTLGFFCGAVSASASDRIFANGFEPCCTLGGEVTGLTGNGLVLQLVAGAISEDKPISANGGGLRLYTFVRTAPAGTGYTVTVSTQPAAQTCTPSNASGTVASVPVDNINIICVAGPTGLIWDDGAWDDSNWQ